MIASTCSRCSPIVRLLLEKGADPNLKDSRGASAARLAASTDPESFSLLVKAGAPFDGADRDGVTPLMEAAAACELATVRSLVHKGARINSFLTYGGKVKHGEIELTHITPLMFAAPFCPADVTKALLDGGADVKMTDSRGMTPLMWAIASETQDVETVRLLVRAGSDVNVKTKVGETALDWANKFGNAEILGILAAAGAHPGDRFVLPKRLEGAAKTPAEARDAGMALLERSSTECFRESGCVGCHHQMTRRWCA